MEAHPGTAVPAELLDPRLWVAEVVYMPIETQLLKDARERGCRTLDGAAMVALQAADRWSCSPARGPTATGCWSTSTN